MTVTPKETHSRTGPLGVLWTYVTLTAASKAEAMEYLQNSAPPRPNTYICIETPEGVLCKDRLGLYEEITPEKGPIKKMAVDL